MNRRALLSAIHIGKKQTGLDEAVYRAMLSRLTGKASCKDMSEAELAKVANEFKRLGGGNAKPKQFYRGGVNQSVVRKALAFWWLLYCLDEAEEPTEARLLAFIHRQMGDKAKPAALRFVSHEDLRQVIEALKQWLNRLGVKSNADERIEWQRATILAQWKNLRGLGAVPSQRSWTEETDLKHQLSYFLSKHYQAGGLDMLDSTTALTVMKRLRRWIEKAKVGAQ